MKDEVGDRSLIGGGRLPVVAPASRADGHESLCATLSEPPAGLAVQREAGPKVGTPTAHAPKPAKGSVAATFGHRSMTLSPGF